jgi:hypothetical protein
MSRRFDAFFNFSRVNVSPGEGEQKPALRAGVVITGIVACEASLSRYRRIRALPVRLLIHLPFSSVIILERLFDVKRNRAQDQALFNMGGHA